MMGASPWAAGRGTTRRSSHVRRTTTRTIALVTSLAISGATGTAAATAAPTAQSPSVTASVAADGQTYDYVSGTTTDPRASALLAAARAHLPADWRAREGGALERFGVEPSAARDALRRAIDPTQYQCAPTRLDAYVDGV